MPVIDPAGIEQLDDALKPQRSSQTLLNEADICLRRAVYYRDPELPRPKSEAMLCGTGYHAGLETYYRWRMETGRVHPTPEIVMHAYHDIEHTILEELEDEERCKGLVWETSQADTIARAQNMVNAYFANRHYWGAEYRVLAVEQKIVMPTAKGGWYTSGTIDLAICGKSTILVDHKTAGKPWRKDKGGVRKTNQPATYVDLWRQATGDVAAHVFAFDVMTYDGVFERRVKHVTDHQIEALHRKQGQILPLIAPLDADLPGNTQSFLCSEKWCDYWGICPFGAALGE